MVELDELSREIENRQSRLRELDSSLQDMAPRAGVKRRISNEGAPGMGMGRRMTVGVENGGRRVEYGGQGKRGRMDDDYDEEDYEDEDDRPKRSLLSTVALPAIETKTREEKIKEMEGTEQKEVKQRNRRLFSNLLMGTLRKFQKDEKKIETVEKIQAEKRRAVEQKIEEEQVTERAKVRAEYRELQEKRREEEREIRSLQRKKALIQYAEQKMSHYRQLQNFIGTQTKPTLFFLPAKHTLRSLELLKQSSETIDALIKIRQDELENDLAHNPEDNRRMGNVEREEQGESNAPEAGDAKSGRHSRNTRSHSRESTPAGAAEQSGDEQGDKPETGKEEEVPEKEEEEEKLEHAEESSDGEEVKEESEE